MLAAMVTYRLPACSRRKAITFNILSSVINLIEVQLYLVSQAYKTEPFISKYAEEDGTRS